VNQFDPYRIQQELVKSLLYALLEEVRRYSDTPFGRALLRSLTALLPPIPSNCLVDTYVDGNAVVIVAEGDAKYESGSVKFSTPCGQFVIKKPGTVRNVQVKKMENTSVVRFEL